MKTMQMMVIVLVLLVSGMLPAEEQTTGTTATQMDPAMQEAMKKGAPGEQHKALEPFVGRFTTTSRIWMKPGEEAQETTGTAQHDWVLGGRFVKMEMRGDMGGQPFEGVGFLGYDNLRGEYTMAWLDSMNTGITRSTGQFDPATKTLSEKGTFSCPMTGEKDRRFRGEWKITDRDTLAYTMYQSGPDGKETKAMEASFKRVK